MDALAKLLIFGIIAGWAANMIGALATGKIVRFPSRLLVFFDREEDRGAFYVQMIITTILSLLGLGLILAIYWEAL
ncbi:hypothetical protein [Qipengyuania gelatinilytica]|uniref:DUF1761 family protein n=1 Tax=Qipengyuania gelatinilytica TaxID=2867231 RepID=A0ABX9A359_9SPHN|nr:hypothetical protein [Qipengyuania gelatinilytica]QZD95700.1 hypothetical protein K3136_02945 [Qipengyuania gelatinilytica]